MENSIQISKQLGEKEKECIRINAAAVIYIDLKDYAKAEQQLASAGKITNEMNKNIASNNIIPTKIMGAMAHNRAYISEMKGEEFKK